MENADLTLYLTHWEDAWRVTREYVATVIKACEERNATHAKETEARKEVIKSSDPEDPVVRLLEATYRHNKITLVDRTTINTKDHSAYIQVAKVDVGTVIKKSVFSMAAYWEVLQLKGGDTAKFDKEVGAKFKMSAKGSRAPDTEKVSIDQIMLVCQRENGRATSRHIVYWVGALDA